MAAAHREYDRLALAMIEVVQLQSHPSNTALIAPP